MSNITLPDFDKMQELINEIRYLAVEVSKLEIQIKYSESIVFRECKEKGMAVNFIESAYKFTGLNDELLPLRASIADKQAELNAKRHELELYKSIIEVWRTISANERLGLQ